MMFSRRQSSFLFRIPFPPFGHSTTFPFPFGHHPPFANLIPTFPFTNQSHFLHSSNNNLSISPHNQSTPHKMFHLSEEVQNALHSGGPIVALESALITHGLQNPLNSRWSTFLIIAEYWIMKHIPFSTFYFTLFCVSVLASVWSKLSVRRVPSLPQSLWWMAKLEWELVRRNWKELEHRIWMEMGWMGGWKFPSGTFQIALSKRLIMAKFWGIFSRGNVLFQM